MPYLQEAERIRRFDAMGYTSDERVIIEDVRICSANGYMQELSYRAGTNVTTVQLWLSGKVKDIGHRRLMKLKAAAEDIIERENI